ALAGEPIEELSDRTHDVSELDLAKLLEEPEVASASRRVQRLQDAPLSVSVVNAVTIQGAAADGLPDVLRRVPGAYVVQTDVNAYYVGLRGLNGFAHRNALFLLDGRNVSELTTGNISWGALPFDAGELETVEVIRGPGSTLYGAGAFSGVINARTKRP